MGHTKKCVRVSADNDINVRGSLCEADVLFVAQMCQGNNALNVPVLSLDGRDRALHGFDGVLKCCSLPWPRDHLRRLSGNGHNGHVHPPVLSSAEDLVRNDVPRQGGVGGLHVRGNDGEGEVAEELSQDIVTLIPLVIPQSHRVEAHLIHDGCRGFTPVQGVEQRALEFVAGMEEQ